MIPLHLRVRNFMSYGDEPATLDLVPIHLACLSGGNGHGKSALLDALTWALWGRSRARRDDDLVRQGATEMEVELVFEVGARHYRVLRKRTLRRGSGTSALELQALGDDGTYQAITGGTMNETQGRVNNLLKIGYETFINSSFLLQGRADEFTVKPPAQRKAVLGEILGLERYDDLCDRARERARSVNARATALRDEMAATERELSRRPDLTAERDAVQSAHADAVRHLREAELALRAATAERQRLALEERSLQRLQETIEALDAETATLERRRRQAQEAAEQAEALLAREGEIAAALQTLRRLRAESEEMGERAGRVVAVERHATDLRHAIERETSALQAALTAADQDEERAAKRARQEPVLRRQLEEHELAERRVPLIEGERAALALDLQGLRGEIAALESENTRLAAEMGPLRERLKLLNERGAACPVCRAPMSEEERQRVYEEYRAEGVARSEQRKRNEARIGELQRRCGDLEARDEALVATLDGQQKLLREVSRLRHALEEATAAVAAVGEARERGAVVRQTLEREDYAQEARAALATTLDEVRRVGYDERQHRLLRRQTEELATVELEAAALEGARERRQSAITAAAQAGEDLARRHADRARAEGEAAALRLTLVTLPEVAAQVETCEAAVAAARQAGDDLDRRAVALNERLSLLDAQEEGLRLRRTELAALDHEAGAYTELGTIFGKKGIQAMLIDTALPELENRANALLSRMSDGTMQVQFVTQAQGSKGDLLETLEIRLADASGTRPYELFSGGEAFRANFAIRIALSRLLAERSGAQLQLLVIDEGFGTQDGQGRERLVEAITSIADDFAKIVVITHIDELKDAFSTRIDVVKGRDGSRILLNSL